MSRCVFPGSFDPLTRGHMNLITRASALFEEVTVAVMINPAKRGCIPFEDRIRILEQACAGLPKVRVVLWDGLLSDYMRQQPGAAVIRGVRSAAEFEQERAAASVNRMLNPGMETLLIPAEDGWGHISSSTVREIALFGGDYRDMVPACVYDEISRWLSAPAKK